MLSGSASSHARTRGQAALERIRARAPIARRSRREAMGRRGPRPAATPWPALRESRRGCPRGEAPDARVTGGQFREVVLHGADLLQEP